MRGMSVSQSSMCLLTSPATCDASLQPFTSMRSKFFDGIEGGNPTSQLQNKVFTIYLRGGISVVMEKWKVYERICISGEMQRMLSDATKYAKREEPGLGVQE